MASRGRAGNTWPQTQSHRSAGPTAESPCFHSMPLPAARLQGPPFHVPVWPFALRLPGEPLPCPWREHVRRVPRGRSAPRFWGGRLGEAGSTSLSQGALAWGPRGLGGQRSPGDPPTVRSSVHRPGAAMEGRHTRGIGAACTRGVPCVCLCGGHCVTGADSGGRRGCGDEGPGTIPPVVTEAALWFRNPAAHFQPLPAGGTRGRRRRGACRGPQPALRGRKQPPLVWGVFVECVFLCPAMGAGLRGLCSAVRALYPAPPYPVPAPPGTAVRRPSRGVRASHVLKSWASLRVRVFLQTSAVRSWCKVFSFTDYKMTSCGPHSCLSSEARVHGTVFPFCS